MDTDKLRRADELETTAKRLREEAFAERPLPDFWRVGQKVRLLRDMRFYADAGTVVYVVRVDEKHAETPAPDYQIFWTGRDPLGHTGRFWTTPDAVELVEDV